MTDKDAEEHYRDCDRIDVGDAAAMDYWAVKFGVSKSAIENAVAKVGTRLSEVAVELWKTV
jgi:hypothetical protein